jgi:hypothetical protein
MSKETLHVVPNEGGWAVKRAGTDRNTSTHTTQRDAIEAANDLAKDGDVVVIHRADGTIRARTTYTDPASTQNGSDNGSRSKLEPRDVVSVGSRVSWSAILAGVVVGLTVYMTLGLLAMAIGVTTVDQMRSKTFETSAAIAALFCLLVALFVGGFVASRTTAGEQHGEAMIYGLLVWATMFAVMVTAGTSMGVGIGTWVQQVNNYGEEDLTPDNVQEQLNLTDDQAVKYAKVWSKSGNLRTNLSLPALAWWTVGAAVLSILAAVGGSIVGAGPELVLRRWRDRRVAVARAG